MLTPEAPERFPGIVLSIGEYVRALGATTLTGSRSTVHFTIPAAIGGGAQAVTVEPARVQLNPGSAPPNDSVTLLGSKLTSGIAQSLVLRAAAWSRLTPPVNRVELDPAMNPGWALSLAADRIDFRAQPTLAFIDGGVPRIVDVLPGIYAASLRTVIGDRVFAGERMTSGVESNQIAFAVCRTSSVKLAVNDGCRERSS